MLDQLVLCGRIMKEREGGEGSKNKDEAED